MWYIFQLSYRDFTCITPQFFKHATFSWCITTTPVPIDLEIWATELISNLYRCGALVYKKWLLIHNNVFIDQCILNREASDQMCMVVCLIMERDSRNSLSSDIIGLFWVTDRIHRQTSSDISRNLVGNKLRCSWSNANRQQPTDICICDLTPDLNTLHKDNCKTRRDTFKFWDWCGLYWRFYGTPDLLKILRLGDAFNRQ